MTGTVRRETVAVRTPDGALLHTTVEGPDTAPVTAVLAHGWTLSQAAWDEVAAELTGEVAAGRVRLVRYDQRGHGRSTWGTAGAASIDLLGHDLAAVLDRCAPDGPVVLGGHSMGGMTIMCLAAARPELFGARVRGALLVATSAGDLRRDSAVSVPLAPVLAAGALAGARLLEAARRLSPPTSRRQQRLVRSLMYGPDATDEMVRSGAHMLAATPVRTLVVFYAALGEHEKRDALAALTGVPVEVLVGEQDRLTPVRHSEQLRSALPDATLHVEPRAGHMLPQERPALVAAALGRLVVGA